MKICPVCSERVEHLKKHMKSNHFEEYVKRFTNQEMEKENVMKRPHVCPVVYLQNFATLSPKYLNKKYTLETYLKPDRKDYLIYVHDKITNSPIFQPPLSEIGVKSNFYSKQVETYLEKIEGLVSKDFRRMREMTYTRFINPFNIFRFLMSQLVRTPKFLQKLEIDLIYLKNMSDEEFNNSLMGYYRVIKPKKITQKILTKIQQDMILHNTLEKIYKWATMTLLTNHTQIPFITSTTPVIYNNIEFFPSYLPKRKRFEFSTLFNEEAIFLFVIDPRFAIVVSHFDNKREDALITYDEVLDEEKIMILNVLMYQYSDRMILMQDKDPKLIKEIRKKCGDKIDKSYNTMQFTYKSIERYRKEKLDKEVKTI